MFMFAVEVALKWTLKRYTTQYYLQPAKHGVYTWVKAKPLLCCYRNQQNAFTSTLLFIPDHDWRAYLNHSSFSYLFCCYIHLTTFQWCICCCCCFFFAHR